jgi:hypothetical protein
VDPKQDLLDLLEVGRRCLLAQMEDCQGRAIALWEMGSMVQNHVLPELESRVDLVGLMNGSAHVPLVEKEVVRGMVPNLQT